MTNVEINTYLAFGYLGWIIAYLITCVSLKDRSRLSRIFWSALLVLWFVHTGSIALRWAESYWMGIGHAPLSNLYESLVFFSWSVALGLIVVWKKFGEDLVPLFGAPIVFLILASTFLIDPNIRPLIPALQSNWLVAHVFTCFLGYAGFAVSFVAAILLLVSRASAKIASVLPDKRILDEINVRPLINASATETHLGGSIMNLKVVHAMEEASQSFFDIRELHEGVSRRLAILTRNEDAMVSAGVASAL